MTGVLEKKINLDPETHRGERLRTMEAETGVMFLQAKNHQRLPENQQKLRDGQWAGDRVSLTALDGANQGELTPAPGWFSLTLSLRGCWPSAGRWQWCVQEEKKLRGQTWSIRAGTLTHPVLISPSSMCSWNAGT